MVAPVTGPFTKVRGIGSPHSKSQTIYKQKKPIDRPLPYVLTNLDNTLNTRNGFYIAEGECFGTIVCPNYQGAYQYAINDCASKLRSKVSDSALWAVNLAEYRQSVDLIYHNLVHLSRWARAILKRDPSALLFAGRGSGLSPIKDLSKTAADLWLMWSFGAKPLMQDIFSAIDILQTPIKASTISARRSYGVAFTSGPTSGSIYTNYVVTGTDFCSMGCQVTISNPNLYLANNLGLANPALVAWELIPFSFVVDWFASVGQFLENGSAWLGLTVTNPYTSYGRRAAVVKNDKNIFDSPQNWHSNANVCWMTRRTSILESAIVVRPQKLPGWQRAANAAAVLVQLLQRR